MTFAARSVTMTTSSGGQPQQQQRKPQHEQQKPQQHTPAVTLCEQTTMELLGKRLEDLIPRSVLDKVFFVYYVFQIVSTLGLDMQGTFPAFLYPSWIRWFYTHHLETWRDPWLANTWHHPWYFSICLWEYTLHVPFYFIAAYAYYSRINNTDKCSWIRTPVILYCIQTMTAVSGVVLMALMEDFSHYDPDVLVPSGFQQRLKLAGMYSLFFIVCLLNLLDALTGRDYVTPRHNQRQQ